MPLLAVPDLHAPALVWAQCYGSNDLPVFPCLGKRPLTPNGFHDATCDPFHIEIWWRQWPDANIGTPMGHGRFAIDIDPRAGGDDTLFALERQYGALPHTLMSHTGGGGNHYIYLEPVGGILNKAHVGQGIDVQGLGSYIILPPSIHPDTGKAYAWDVVDGPDDIDPQPAPDWLLALLTAPAGSGQNSRAASFPGALIPVGQRDNALTQFAGGLRRAGASADEIRAALAIRNQCCEIPLDAADLDRIARSIARYDPPPQMLISAGPADVSPGLAGPGAADPQAWGTPREKLQFVDLADMLKKSYPLPRWLIDGLIPEGLTFFVGKPKSSKTYLAYSLALSLVMSMQSHSSQWLGYYDIRNKGPVVYITLEDDEAESWHRILELAPGLQDLPASQFLFHHGIDFPHLGADLVTAVKEDIIDAYHPVLIVLDPISYLYAPTKKGVDQFGDVKNMLLPLRWLGKEHHLTILGVDHRRKTSADDVDIFESTYGSNAKIAVADAILMIVRDAQEITLHSKVRKAEEQTITLGFTFDDLGRATWTWKGATNGLVSQGQYGDIRQKIIDALSGFQQPMGIADIIAAINIPDSRQTRKTIYNILWRAQRSQEVQKTTRGQYVWSGGN
jgi:hypothetical protein